MFKHGNGRTNLLLLKTNYVYLARRADSSKSRQLLKTCDWDKLEILLVLSLSLSFSHTYTHTHKELDQ
jgi:hypothetical protein